MKLVSWNVNGIRSIHKRGQLTPFIEKFRPDMLCFQETKAEEHQSEVDLPEYEEYWNSSEGKKGYAGTAIFTKVKPETVTLGFPEDILKKYQLADKYGDPNAEGRVIAAEFEHFYLVNCYTPNAKPDLGRLPLRHKGWDPAFLAYLEHLEKEKPVIACGDLNVAHTEDDLANPKQNEGEKGFTKEEREGIDKLIQAGFVDTFRLFTEGKGFYTWWSHFSNARERNVGWRIDYFFVSKDLAPLVTRARIHPEVYGSDHCPVSLDIDISS
ncbi:exodeoxyribonuclease III [Candidatus Kaiserbacteria bacterium]|nr:exodeoxyribonuclease III [Candidatus Kaiserbacteria bacterium]